MPRFRFLCLKVVLLTSLTGCFPFSVMDVTMLALSMPVPAPNWKAELTGYTIGPVSSDDFPDLLQSAIPPGEGEVYFFGRTQWSALADIKQSSLSLQQTITTITDTDILSLWWSEKDEQYEILMRLPYFEIQSAALNKLGFGVTIKLCHEIGELLLGGQEYSIGQVTRMNFLNQNGMLGDSDKTERAFEFLDDKINPKEELDHAPDPCNEDQEPTIENQGFSEDDLLGLT